MKQSRAMWASEFDRIAANMRQCLIISRVVSMAAPTALVTSFS
jgi:hypothetical protein